VCRGACVPRSRNGQVQVPFIRKRAAQLFSKSRFIAAQFDAYFKDDLWLDIARHSNRMAARLQQGIRASTHARLGWNSDANEVFPVISKTLAKTLMEKGAMFYEWTPPSSHPDLRGRGRNPAQACNQFCHHGRRRRSFRCTVRLIPKQTQGVAS
jgi:threonine aldolase